jgi:hypothetical protein
MKVCYGVAIKPRFSGADVEDLLPKRFITYDDAKEYSEKYQHECVPTIFLILNNKYAFYCERSKVTNEPYKIYSLTTFNEGQIEIRIWWKDFIKQPQSFLHLSAGIINN